ncbi:putative phage tail protein [Sphingomonas bacterium]|uniref:putative phage tail protein n=1 Tax=Sphingomonas bacterium TaxID=1895847 RepID=UPI0015752A8D|nr:putative phage tail protein [Sphingomonas bacterium]
MSTAEPISFEVNNSYGDGGTYTPVDTGSATQPAPIAIAPVAPVVATPATTVTVAAAAPAPVPTPRRAATALPVPVVAGVARYSAADYAGAARALMPRGRAWSTDRDGQQSCLLAGIGRVLERVDAAAMALLGGTRPGELTTMLPEWEAALGLPDPCAGDTPTIAQRLDQVRGRFVGAQGQSRQRYVDYAAALGFVIEITTYAAFRAGQSTVGQPVAGDEWTFVWGVRVTSITGSLPVGVLLCELETIKPAETTILLLS